MNLLDSNLLIPYLNLFLLIVVVALHTINPAKRHREWLYKSFVVGLGLGPLLFIASNNQSLLSSITWLNGNWSLVELGLFSGLCWAVASTWLMSVNQLPGAALAVNIQWLKVIGVYVLVLASVLVGKNFGIDATVVLIAAIGLCSIALAARQPQLLVRSLISGVVFTLLGLLVTYLATYLSLEIGTSSIPFIPVSTIAPLSTLAAFGTLALSSPIVSRWWFGQPLK